MPSSLPVNHVFVDFENVQQLDLAVAGDRVIKLTVFLGEKQRKLDSELVEALLARAEQVQLVRLTSSGRNAVDFALTYYLGRAVCGDPTGFFHVVSKDKGFDPLMEHLRRNHVKILRHDSFSAAVERMSKPAPNIRAESRAAAPVPAPAATSARPASSITPVAKSALKSEASGVPVEEIWAYVTRNRAHQPKRRDTLRALLQNHFHLTEPQAHAGIQALADATRITIDEKGKVTYHVAPPVAAAVSVV